MKNKILENIEQIAIIVQNKKYEYESIFELINLAENELKIIEEEFNLNSTDALLLSGIIAMNIENHNFWYLENIAHILEVSNYEILQHQTVLYNLQHKNLIEFVEQEANFVETRFDKRRNYPIKIMNIKFRFTNIVQEKILTTT